MSYLDIYLTIGVVSLVIIYGSHKLTAKPKGADIKDLLESINPDRHKWQYKSLNNYVAPLMAAILVIIVWPAAIYMKLNELIQKDKTKDVTVSEEKKFEVTGKDLIKKLTIDEIEKIERVEDPLHAVPSLPFGHLNASWLAFLASNPPGAVIWSFTSTWNHEWGSDEVLSGYVWVTETSLGPHFITERY